MRWMNPGPGRERQGVELRDRRPHASLRLRHDKRASPQAVRFLEKCVSSREVYCLGSPTIMSYLRIATHLAIFTHPLSMPEAMRNIEGLI